jgi:hypothetical protein
MKLYIGLLASALIACAACNKEDDSVASPAAAPERQTPYTEYVPSAYTQKLLLEMYSAAGCATCPDAEYKYRQYAAAHPDQIYGVCIHNGDAMDHPQFDVLNNEFNITAYSSGSFNRLPFNNEVVIHKTAWTNTIVNSCINRTAKCGLKLQSSYNGNTANVTVSAAFNSTVAGDIRLTVYLLEDSVSGTGTGYNQSNYYNTTASSPFYQMGNPIVGYQHNYVLRKVATPSFGEIIPQVNIHSSGKYTANYSIDISGYDKNQLYIVAFVNKKGTTALTHEILNVQRVKLGEQKSWD